MRVLYFSIALAAILSPSIQAAERSSISEPILCALEYRETAKFADNIFVRLSISTEGAIRWNDAAVSQRQFAQYLSDLGKMMPRPVFSFDAEPGTTFAVAAPIVLRIQKSGIRWMYPGAVDTRKHVIGCEVVDHWADRKAPVVNLQIKPDGSFVWSGRKISPQQLADYFAQAGRAKPVPLINVQPSPDTPYSTMMSLIAAAHNGGISDIAFGPYGR